MLSRTMCVAKRLVMYSRIMGRVIPVVTTTVERWSCFVEMLVGLLKAMMSSIIRNIGPIKEVCNVACLKHVIPNRRMFLCFVDLHENIRI